MAARAKAAAPAEGDTSAEAVVTADVTESQSVAPAAAPAADAEPEELSGPAFEVQACAVLRTLDGGERYIYGPAVIDVEAFTAESVEHAISVGAIVELGK